MTPHASGADLLQRALGQLVILRAVMVTLLLGPVLLGLVRTERTGSEPLFALIATTYGLTIGYAGLLRWPGGRLWMADLQCIVDVLLVGTLVKLTGGFDSLFTPLFVWPVVGASWLRGRRGGLQMAALIAVLGVGLVMWQSDAVGTRFDPDALSSLVNAVYVVGLNVSGLLAIALLTGYLAERLSSAHQHLERATSELVGLQAFNQFAIDSLAGGLMTADAAGTVLTANRMAEVILGELRQGLAGRRFDGVLQLKAAGRDALADVLETGRPQRIEIPFTRPDGRVIDLGLTTAALQDGDRRLGYVLSFQDLTETNRRARDEARQARLAAVGEMAAGIAHELRNPLASMTGSIQVLIRDLPLSPEQAQLLDIVLRESDRLNGTIESFLAYAGARRRQPQRVNLATIVEETVSLLRHGPECRDDHVIEVEAPTAAWVSIDETELRQVVWNLASNALRAMPQGGPLTLSVTPGTGQSALAELRVRDGGIGMSPEECEQVFHPFHSTFPGGTGLGLAVVHRIVTDAGGTVRLASRERYGTEVLVQLPAAEPSSGASPADEQARRAS